MVEELDFINVVERENNIICLSLNASGGPVLSGPNTLQTYKKFEEMFQLAIAVEMLMNLGQPIKTAFMQDIKERRKLFDRELKSLTNVFNN